MRIIYVKAARAKGYTVLGIECDGDKKSLTVRDRVYHEVGSPLISDVVDAQTFNILLKADFEYRATKKALNVLAYGDNSKITLKNKLLKDGIPNDIAESTVCEMVRLNYIDEDRALRRIIADEVNLRYTGPIKLLAKLSAKGYSREKIKSVCDELSREGVIDFSEAKRLIIEKKLPEGAAADEIKKLLYKSGYGVC